MGMSSVAAGAAAGAVACWVFVQLALTWQLGLAPTHALAAVAKAVVDRQRSVPGSVAGQFAV